MDEQRREQQQRARCALQVLKEAGLVSSTRLEAIPHDAYFAPEGIKHFRGYFIVMWMPEEEPYFAGNYWLLYNAVKDFWGISHINAAYQRIMPPLRRQIIRHVVDTTGLGCEAGLARCVADYVG